MTGAPIPLGGCGTSECARFKWEVLCDNGTGPATSFLRCYLVDCDSGFVTATIDTELDGFTPYVVIGDVGVCSGDINVAPTNVVDAELVCFDAAPSPLVRITIYNPQTGDLVAGPFWRDPLTGALVVPVGVVIPCPESDVDVEVKCLCDDGFDPSEPFIRVYTYVDGVNTAVSDFELDGVTPYVLIGTAVLCATTVETTVDGESIRAGYDRISGAGSSWAIGVDTVGRVQAVTFLVNDRTGVTVTDAFGNVTSPASNFSTYEWAAEALDSGIQSTLSVAISAAAGDVAIIWTEVA